MLQIMLTEYTNGHSVVVYDDKGNYLVREITETKLDALKVVNKAVQDLIQKEINKLQEMNVL